MGGALRLGVRGADARPRGAREVARDLARSSSGGGKIEERRRRRRGVRGCAGSGGGLSGGEVLEFGKSWFLRGVCVRGNWYGGLWGMALAGGKSADIWATGGKVYDVSKVGLSGIGVSWLVKLLVDPGMILKPGVEAKSHSKGECS